MRFALAIVGLLVGVVCLVLLLCSVVVAVVLSFFGFRYKQTKWPLVVAEAQTILSERVANCN